MISKESLHFFGALLVVLLLGANPAQAQVAANVVFSTGGVVVVSAEGATRHAERNGEIRVGEVVETNDGKVQLRFSDGATMSLQPESRFRVDQFRFAEQTGKASPEDRGFFSLLKGGLRTITGLIGKQDNRQYRVSTSVATIGIRGTDYSANLGTNGLSVSTFGGVVEVCNDAGCTLVPAGQTLQLSDSKSGANLGPTRGSQPGGNDRLPAPGSLSPELPAVQPSMQIEAPSVPQQVPNYGPGGPSRWN